jgi:hypothetical protein
MAQFLQSREGRDELKSRCPVRHLPCDGGQSVNKKPTPGEIVIIAGGAVALVFSFLPFFKLDIGGLSDDVSAWGSGLFPVATLIPIFAAVAAVLVALKAFANFNYPANGVLGFGWNSLLLALTFFSAVLALAYLLVDKGGYDLGIGFFLVFIGAIGSFVGAILLQNEARTGASGPPRA